MAKQKYYVVWKGRKPGIYSDWPSCQEQINGFPGARFKSFSTKREAESAYTGGQASKADNKSYTAESISVDAGTHGNPGPVEYRGVHTKSGKVLFERKPYPKGTNNMGEFLAIVHALYWQKEKGSTLPIYSDSQTAIGWVKTGKARPTLVRNETTKEIWNAVNNAEKWLHTHGIIAPIRKWETKQWGEIKADYNRK